MQVISALQLSTIQILQDKKFNRPQNIIRYRRVQQHYAETELTVLAVIEEAHVRIMEELRDGCDKDIMKNRS
jgi:hypothetical protein